MALEYLVSRLRTNWKNDNVEIVYDPDQYSKGLFVNLAPHTFSTIVSNLVKNGVEACQLQPAKVEISIFERNGYCELSVSDNGKGISSELVNLIFNENFSHRKDNGSGIGLFHAKQSVESIGGCINVKSKVHEGSLFTIKIPLTSRPDWYIDRILVKQPSGVIVIDDEVKYYKILKDLLDKNNIPSLYFSSLKDFKTNVEKVKNPLNEYLFVVDYEFQNQPYDGFEIISELCIFDNSIMMTNMADEQLIMDKCEEDGVQLLPKKLLSSIKVATPSRQICQLEATFIDDDSRVLKSLKRESKQYGIQANFFSHSGHLTKDFLSGLSRDHIFFIDFDMGETTGDEICRDLHQKGYENLHILTGFDASDLPSLPFVKSISQKTFPTKVLDGYL